MVRNLFCHQPIDAKYDALRRQVQYQLDSAAEKD